MNGINFLLIFNGVPSQKIGQLDQREQVKKRNILLGVVSLITLALAGIAGYGIVQKTLAEEHANEAKRQEEMATGKAELAQKEQREANWQAPLANHNERKVKRPVARAGENANEANRQKDKAAKNETEAKRLAAPTIAGGIHTAASSHTNKDPIFGAHLPGNLGEPRIHYGGLRTAPELATKSLERSILRGHTNWVTRAAFNPDRQFIVTASHDPAARRWQADGTGEPLVPAINAV